MNEGELNSEMQGQFKLVENVSIQECSQVEAFPPALEFDVVTLAPERRSLGLVSDHVPLEWEHSAMTKHWDILGTLHKAGDKTVVERDDGKIQIGQELGSPAVFWDETGGRPTLTSDPPDFVATFLPEFDRRHPGAIAFAVGETYRNCEVVQGTPVKAYTHALEASTKVTPVDTFVQKMLCPGQMSMWYGDSGVGKTFLAGDLVCHLAASESKWMGLRIERCGVVYAALEGLDTVKARVAGWKIHYELNAPLALDLIEQNFNLGEDKAAERLIATIQEADELMREKFGVSVGLLVIDTFSRAAAGADENSTADMTAMIKVLDDVKEQTGCHVMFIHHSGKNAQKGARGNSALRASVDTEISIAAGKEPKTGVLTVTKQRALAEKITFGFRLETVELGGHDKWGEPITTAICKHASDVKPNSQQTRRQGKNQTQRVLDVLKSMLSDTNTSEDKVNRVRLCDWELECERIFGGRDPRMKQKQFNTCKKKLLKEKSVKIENGYACLL